MPLYGAVIDKGSVEAKYKELAYLKTALINGCEYCFRAHSASGKKNGVTEEQIKSAGVFPAQRGFRRQGESGAAVCRASYARRIRHPAARRFRN